MKCVVQVISSAAGYRQVQCICVPMFLYIYIYIYMVNLNLMIFAGKPATAGGGVQLLQ